MIVSTCNRRVFGAAWTLSSRSRLSRLSIPASLLLLPRHPTRHLTTTRTRRKDDPRVQTVQQTVGQKPLGQEGSVKPESVQKSRAEVVPAGQDPLLAEPSLSNKEQRKADWAIIKEMSQYLWPKVMPISLPETRCAAETERSIDI